MLYKILYRYMLMLSIFFCKTIGDVDCNEKNDLAVNIFARPTVSELPSGLGQKCEPNLRYAQRCVAVRV